MKYYGNYMDDVVVREDENGVRYKKYDNSQIEIGPCSMADKESYGGESYGYFHDLDDISEEDYNGYGKTWRYGCNPGESKIVRL